MLKAAFLGSGGGQGASAGGFSSGNLFNRSAGQTATNVRPASTPYDRSTGVNLGARAGNTGTNTGANKPPTTTANGSPTTTTSGQSIGDMTSGIGNFLKGMVLPRSGSGQDMGQWLGGPMGKMIMPMLGATGPMALPAIMWMQQMMNGNMKDWNTITAGPGKEVRSSLSKDIKCIMGIRES